MNNAIVGNDLIIGLAGYQLVLFPLFHCLQAN